MIRLYSGPLSLFTAKVRIALAEKGVDYELVDVPWTAKGGYSPKHPFVAKHNPKGQVPVLENGDLVLYDSTLILEYLEALHPEPALYPRALEDRFRCQQLELEGDEVFFPPVLALIRERFYPLARGEAVDEEAVRIASDAIGVQYAGLEAKLADRDFLMDTFTVADVTHFLVAHFARGLGVSIPESLPNLRAWFERIAARPAVAADLSLQAEALKTRIG